MQPKSNFKTRGIRIMKRIFSVILILLLISGIIPQKTFAALNYTIESAEEFIEYVEGINSGMITADALLLADIDVSNYNSITLCLSSLLLDKLIAKDGVDKCVRKKKSTFRLANKYELQENRQN